MLKKFFGYLRREQGQVRPPVKGSLIKKAVFVLVLCLLLVGVGLATRKFVQKETIGKLKFSLEARASDLNGMEKKSEFILKANQGLSDNAIKSYLKFEPPIDYEVVASKPGFLSLVKSVTSGLLDASANNEYIITPQKDLTEGVVYKVTTASSTEANIDHDYSWAFKVKEQFNIKESLPSNKAAGVPVNTGIEVTFNRLDIAKNVESYFDIQPAVKGRFEVGINKVVFIPENDLEQKKLYIVTIKKGYQSGEKNEVLAEEKTFSFETTAKDSSAVLPYLNWNSDYSEITPDKEGFLEASGIATSSELVVYKFSGANNFLTDYYNYQQRANNWSNFNQEKYFPSTNPQETFKFKPELLKKDENENFGLIKLPSKLETGFYVFKLTVGDVSDYSFARVSPLAYYYSEINGDGLVWAYDFTNKKPFTNLRAYFQDKNSNEKLLGTTDENGLVKFDSSSEEVENKNISLIFRGETFKETAIPDIGRIFEKRKNYFQGYLNTDRYAYRLTDKVHFWGVVKGRSFDLKQKKVKVSLDGLVEQEVVVSPFDTIEGELNFQGLPSGSHNLVVSYNDETITQASIEVFAFEKPLYKIEILTDKIFSTVDAPIKATVKVHFFDGTPVKNMDLNYVVNWRGEQNGTLKTNNQGEAEINYTPDYYFEQTSEESYDSWTSYPQTLRFTVRPTLSEEGEIWGESYVNIYGPKINLQSEEVGKGDSIVFKSKVNQLNLATSTEDGVIGQPVIGQAVKVRVVRYYYEKIYNGETYDQVEKVKIKNYRYEVRKQLIKEASGVTNKDGEWLVVVDKKEVNSNGYLKAIFSAEDDNGKKVMSASESYNYYPGNNGTTLSLTNIDLEQDKKISYKIGDKINLKAALVGTDKPIDNRTLIVSFQEGLRGTTLIDQEVFVDDFTENYLPSMSYMAVKMMANGFLQSDVVTASFDEEERRLNIDIKADKERYRPRENVNLNIKIKDKNNLPVKAVANVATVDEALFNITPWAYSGDILGSYYGDIYVWPNSLSTSYVTDFKNGVELGGCFVAGTEITMGDDSLKKIEEVGIGDEVETFVNDISSTKASSIVQGISSHEVAGYLLINNKLKVTPEHKIYLNSEWKLAGEAKVGDYLVNEQRQNETIKSIKYVKGKNTKVYNIVVGRFHTYFANGFYVHNAEKGGGGDARNFFQDTPLYKQLESDSNGEIKASFVAPDNLTSWRVSVNAFSPNEQKAGNKEILVPVGLPLFVDAIVAKQYLVGDAPIIKVRVFGDEYKKDQSVEYSVNSDSLKINYSTTTLANEINIPIEKMPLGKHKLIVSVKQGSLKDALEKNFTVYENYLTRLKADSQLITDGINNLKKNANGFTDVLFVDDGKGKYFNKLLELNWQGSVRADIQSASYLAAKILNENFYNGRENFYADVNLGSYLNRNNYFNALALFPYGAVDYALTGKLADVMPDKFDNSTVLSGLNARLNDKNSDVLEISQVLYGLAALGQPELPFINYLNASESITPEVKIYLALALYKTGDVEGAREIYQNDLLPLLKVNNDTAYLEIGNDRTKNIKTTALFGVLVSDLEKAADNPLVQKVLTYLEKNQPTDDSIALETAMILNNEMAKENSVDSSFNYQTSSRKESVDLNKGQSVQLTLSENELKSLLFSDVKGRPRVISYYNESANVTELAKSNQVSVKRSYFVNNKEVTDFKEGDLVLVRLDPTFAADAPEGNYQLADYLPASLRPAIRQYSPDFPTGTECDVIWYPIKTTDEATYFNVGKWFEKTDTCQHRTINYHARVVGKGSFKAQGAVIQSLNYLDVVNISEEKTVKVK